MAIFFSLGRPGRLTDEAGTLYMDWKVAGSHAGGYSASEVEDYVGSTLESALGWERAGLTGRQSSSASVTWQIVEMTSSGDPDVTGTTNYNDDGSVLVELVASEFGNTNLVNHEAGHAYFGAEHTASGTMETGGEDDPPWPTDEDIADVEAWLAGTSPDVIGGQHLYWFPGDLPHYITRYNLSAASEARFHITVLSGASGVSLKPVYASHLPAMRSGIHSDLTPAVAASARGIYETGWVPVPEGARGEMFVGIRVVFESDTGPEDIAIGLAEVNVR